MEKIFYNSLPQHESHDGSGSEGAEEGGAVQRPERQPSSTRQQRIIFNTLCITLLASFTANIFFVYQQYFVPWKLAERLPTQFAHLKYDVPVETVAHSDFDSMDRMVQDEAWNDPDLEPWSLFVALDDDYTRSAGLPTSQRWPWDSHKGAYIPRGAHDLHCVHVLRSVVNENRDGLPQSNQTWPYAHAIHCLNILREAVVCHADDTPLYTGRLHKNIFEEHPRAGVGTVKMCRDWSALVSWSREHSACYRPVHWFEKGFDEKERYKFCPDGSTPWNQADEGKRIRS